MRKKEYINFTAFQRLHWEVSRPIDDIRVEEEDQDGSIQLLPFENHPVALEYATITGLTGLEVYISDLAEWASDHPYYESDDEEAYHSPEPLKIAREDGNPITIRDFVEQAGHYLTAHMPELIEFLDEIGDTAEDGRYWVDDISDRTGNVYDGPPIVSLRVWGRLSHGIHAMSLEEFWQERRRMSRLREAEAQRPPTPVPTGQWDCLCTDSNGVRLYESGVDIYCPRCNGGPLFI
jgi:hypothetical protein